VIDGQHVPMLAYRLAIGAGSDGGSWLRLEGLTDCDERLLAEVVVPSFCFPENPLFGPLLSPSGYRLRFCLDQVALKEAALAANDPFDALATILHELARMVGGDGSKRFSAALTDLLARLGALHAPLGDLERAWTAVPDPLPPSDLATSP
jgi:hypothetical protein